MPKATALTRLPSNGAPARCSMQSHSGLWLSHLRPSEETMRAMVLWTCSSSKKWTSEGVIFPRRSTMTWSGELTMISETSGSQSSSSMGPSWNRSSTTNLAAWRITSSPAPSKEGERLTYARARSRRRSMPSSISPTRATWFCRSLAHRVITSATALSYILSSMATPRSRWNRPPRRRGRRPCRRHRYRHAHRGLPGRNPPWGSR